MGWRIPAADGLPAQPSENPLRLRIEKQTGQPQGGQNRCGFGNGGDGEIITLDTRGIPVVETELCEIAGVECSTRKLE